MTRSALVCAALSTLLLAACAPAAEAPVESPAAVAEAGDGKEPVLADVELCDAADYRSLIGSNIAATTLRDDVMLRVFGENDIVTQDYRPQRTNIVFDESGEIRKVYCG